MKKNVIIINTARGGIINENDLNIALQKNIIFGAGNHIFGTENHIFGTEHIAFGIEHHTFGNEHIIFGTFFGGPSLNLLSAPSYFMSGCFLWNLRKFVNF